MSSTLAWAYLFSLAKYDDADAVAAVLTASSAPVWRFQGLIAQAYDAYFRGDAISARDLLAEAEPYYPNRIDPDLLSLPTYPTAGFHVIRAHVNWCLGNVQGAASDTERALDIALSLPAEGGPELPPPLRGIFRDFNISGVHAFNTFLFSLQHDFGGAISESRLHRTIVQSHAADAGATTIFASYDSISEMHGEFADWVQGGRRGDTARAAAYERAIHAYEARGPAGVAYFYYNLGELHLAAGEPKLAVASVERGLAHTEAYNERMFVGDLRALRARAVFGDDPEYARGEFRQAMDAAVSCFSAPLRFRVARIWAVTDHATGRGQLADVLAECAGQVSTRELNAARTILAT